MPLSNIAWQRTKKTYQAILKHKFNQELVKGILEKDKFLYYIKQDCIFLKALGDSFSLLAERSENNDMKQIFLKKSKGCYRAEEEIVRPFLSGETNTDYKKSLACMAFSDHLKITCSSKPFELGVAATLPCYWIYHEIGKYIAENSVENNKYDKWIATYSRETFSKNVNILKNIFDELGERASEDLREQMCEEFYISSVLEWHFWNDAYELKEYDSIYNTVE